VQNILDNGKRISKMVMVNNHGQIRQYIKVNIKMEKSMVRECFYGLMIVLIKDNFLKIIFMV
jgi:hypothetical protein